MTGTPAPADRLTLLLARLEEGHGFVPVDAAGIDSFVSAPGVSVLFFAEDPNQVPETWDVAVVLPEVLKDLPEPCRAGAVPPETGRMLRSRYGFTRWPAAVFLRDGGYLGAIEGMRDWPVFLAEARGLLSRPVRRPPTVGIEVRAEGGVPSCH